MSTFSILAAARQRPSAVALICPEGELTFAAVAERTQRVMAWLQSDPARLPVARTRVPEACIGLVADNDPWTLVLIYALLELGVPFLLIHPRLPRPERETLRRRLPIQRLFEPGWHTQLAQNDPAAVGAPAPPIELAATEADQAETRETALCIAFTAGTSGFPKACVLSRKALEHAVAASARNFGWQDDDRWQLCLSLAHMGGLSVALRCLAARRTLVVTPLKTDSFGVDLPQVARDLVQHRVTLISLVPTLLQRLLELPDFAVPSTLRAMLIGGDAVSPGTLQRAQQRRFPVFTSYGLTEMASQVATQRFSFGPMADTGNGPPLSGMEVSLDSTGRILVRGPSLFSGYWQPPTLHLPLNRDGWFVTHDYGLLDADGCLHVLGRDTDLIVSGGENVYPAEVERAIQGHPAVSRCCVFAVPDATWGSMVCALLVGPKTVTLELREFLAKHLMPHQRPRRVAVVAELPHTELGKIDRRAAAQNYLGQLLSLDYN